MCGVLVICRCVLDQIEIVLERLVESVIKAFADECVSDGDFFHMGYVLQKESQILLIQIMARIDPKASL